ncbi:hypothetical protein, partial [Bradyrhizobium sp. P5_C11_2]
HISHFFAVRERPERRKDCKFLSEKIARAGKKLLAQARCRTRQFLPSTILMNATEILHVWRVELARICAQISCAKSCAKSCVKPYAKSYVRSCAK